MKSPRPAFSLIVSALLVGSFALSCTAQNFPPIAVAAPTPREALIGLPILLSSADSIDPDGAPQPLGFLWDFGDGTTSTEANPSRAFVEPRAYRVSLTVSDGADAAVDSQVVHVLAPPTAVAPTRSGMLALNPAGTELWVANLDSNSVSVLGLTADGAVKVAEIAAGRQPRTLAFSPDGGRVYVACQGANELWVLDAATRTLVRRLAVGHEPFGVAVSPTDGRVLVSNQGDATVSVVAPSLVVEKVITVAATPRALAIAADGGSAFVSHLLTRGTEGTLTKLDLATRSVVAESPLVEDDSPDTLSSGAGFPNMLSALALDPSGRAVWFGGLKANTGRGLFANGEMPQPENTTRGFFGKVDAASAAEVVERRIDANDTDSVSAIAFSPNGRWAYVTHQGAGTVSIYDLSAATLITAGDGNSVTFTARIDLGHAPQGIVVSTDGQRGYVANFLSRNVQVLDLANPQLPAVLATVATTEEPLPAHLANGKRLFYRSREPRHSAANYIACASCHADGGGHDGRTWDFTNRGEGLRNTPDLRGRGGPAHGPIHWSGNFDEGQDFENDIVRFFGGTGLAQDGQPPHPPLGAPNAGRSADLDDLAAYVASLTTPPRSPQRKADGTLSVAALRGKALFQSPALQCAVCHPAPRFTDTLLTPDPADYLVHDVGTFTTASGGRLGGPLPGLDTPSLFGLWDSAPYLHDGGAATLLDVLTTRNPGDRHGVTSSLAPDQLEDLIAYLLSLDGSPADEATDDDGDGMSDPWEQLHGFDPANPADADADADGDAAPNQDEFLAGTDPRDPASRLVVRDLRRDADAAAISFPTTRGYSYVPEFSTSIVPANWQPLGGIVGDGAEIWLLDLTPLSGQGFYRVLVSP